MVSPANTYVGLTHKGPAIAPGEPEKYYPTGKRNYTRIVAADDFQGAADALLTKQLGYKSVFILNDKEAYGLGVANDYQNSAKALGLKIAGFTAWDPKASSYEALATRIKQTGADGVSRRADLRERREADQGPPERPRSEVPADRSRRLQRLHRRNGPAADGMYVSVAGIPTGEADRRRASRSWTTSAPRSAPQSTRTPRTRPRLPWSCWTRSNGPTARGRRSRTSCSTRTSRTASSARFSINENGDTTVEPGHRLHPAGLRIERNRQDVQDHRPAAEPREGRLADEEEHIAGEAQAGLPRLSSNQPYGHGRASSSPHPKEDAGERDVHRRAGPGRAARASG